MWQLVSEAAQPGAGLLATFTANHKFVIIYIDPKCMTHFSGYMPQLLRVIMFNNLACTEKDIFVTGRQLADAHKQEEEKLLKHASDTSIMKVNSMHTCT